MQKQLHSPNLERSTIYQLASQEKKMVDMQEKILFSYNIFDDSEWIEITSKFINDERLKNSYVKDARWFINNYSKEYYDEKGEKMKGRYYGKATDSKFVIDHFLLS